MPKKAAAYRQAFTAIVVCKQKIKQQEMIMIKSVRTFGISANELRNEAKTEFQAVITTVKNMIVGATLLCLLLGCLLAFFITRALTGALRQGVACAERLAAGDLTTKISLLQEDEIGQLAHALDATIDELGSMLHNVSDGVTSLDQATTEIMGIAEENDQGCSSTAAKTNTLATASEEMNCNMRSVAAAAEEASTNISTVSTAAQEMTATVDEIAQNMTKTKTISDEAVASTVEASRNVEALEKAADEISQVTTKDIAENVYQASLGIQEVTENIAQSSTVVESVNQEVVEINQITEQTLQNSSQLNHSAQSLATLSQQLRTLVDKFRLAE